MLGTFFAKYLFILRNKVRQFQIEFFRISTIEEQEGEVCKVFVVIIVTQILFPLPLLKKRMSIDISPPKREREREKKSMCTKISHQ
jgi:hypothetical protein